MFTFLTTTTSSPNGIGNSIIILLIAALLILPFFIVYKDAQKNEMNGGVWVAIVLFSGIFLGIAAYLIAKEYKKFTERKHEEFYLGLVEYFNNKNT